MRRGRVFRRCSSCGARIEGKRCPKCGAATFSWAYVVDVSPPGSPKRRQRRGGGFRTKAEAQAALSRLQVETAEGRHVAPSRLTVGLYLDDWLPGVSGEIRPSTYGTYELAVRRLKPLIGDIPLQALTYQQVRTAYMQLTATGSRNGSGLAAKTVHNAHLCLRRALRDAVRGHLIVYNPAEAAHRLPTDERPEIQAWTAGELHSFLAVTMDHPLHALYRLAAHTGMRRGELLGLRWRDVRLAERRVAIRRQISRQRDAIVQGPVKSRSGRRSVSLDAVTADVLDAHRKAQAALAASLGRPGPADGDLVFAHPDGSRLDPDVVSQMFKRLVGKAGLRLIRFHDLRHTHATLALQAGVHPKVVQERLGHSSINVTIDLYSHTVPALQTDAADRIAALVDAARHAEPSADGEKEP